MLLHLNLPYAVPCLISWEWTGPLVKVWYMRGPLCSQNRNEHWSGVYLVWNSLEVSLLGVEQSWGEFMERNGRGRHQYPPPRPPCGSVALSLTTEKSTGKIYVFVRLYEEYIYIVGLRWKSPNFGTGPRPFFNLSMPKTKVSFVEEDPKIVRIHW